MQAFGRPYGGRIAEIQSVTISTVLPCVCVAECTRSLAEKRCRSSGTREIDRVGSRFLKRNLVAVESDQEVFLFCGGFHFFVDGRSVMRKMVEDTDGFVGNVSVFL